MSNPAFPGVIYVTGTGTIKTDGLAWDYQTLPNTSSGWQPQVIKYNYSAGEPIKIEGEYLDGSALLDGFTWTDTWRGDLRIRLLKEALENMLEVQR